MDPYLIRLWFEFGSLLTDKNPENLSKSYENYEIRENCDHKTVIGSIINSSFLL